MFTHWYIFLDDLMSFVFEGAILKYFTAPDIKPGDLLKHPEKEAPVTSRSSKPSSVQETRRTRSPHIFCNKQQLSYEKVINDFAKKKARKKTFWGQYILTVTVNNVLLLALMLLSLRQRQSSIILSVSLFIVALFGLLDSLKSLSLSLYNVQASVLLVSVIWFCII